MEKSVNTMWLSRIKNIGIILMFTVCNAVAQTIDVKDPVLKNYLCTKYTKAMTANCAQLDKKE